MENSKRKGIISILIIAVCLCLCIGATYAYFTDSATSKGNKIQAGKLKVDFELLNKDTLIWNSIKESQDPIFYHEKWEPGYTDVKLLKVDNEETLAIKWEAKFIYEGQLPALANAIEVYVKTSDSEFAYPTSRDDLDLGWEYEGTLTEFAANISTILKGELLSGESDYFGITLCMPTTIEDNTLQGQSIDPFDIQILATQLSYESDAFDEKYDEDAEFPNGGVTPPGETESESDTTTSSSDPTDDPTDDIEPTDSDIFTWDVYDDYAVVTGLKNPGTIAEINIPSTYNGLPVKKIGDWAFYWDSTIESVVIPNSVTTIGDSAFHDCSGLTNVTIGNSVTTIGDSAFNECSGLTGELIIPDSVTIIGDSAFNECSGLTGELIIPDSVTTIGDSAFQYCSGLTSVTIGNSVTTIGDSAFKYCSGLTGELIIPDSVTTIGAYAFFECYGLTSIDIPDSVTTIGNCAFYWCSGLTGELIIPDSVTTIGAYAFSDCYNLTSVTIPKSVTTIGINPFALCSSLTSIVVDDENTAYQSIDGNLYSKDGTLLIAYAASKSDTSFAIPNGVTIIGDYAFSNCDSLISVTIPDSVTTIGDLAFSNCDNLTSVTISDSVTTIGASSFAHCYGLTSIEIPNSITTIGGYAFYDCYNLTSIEIPDSVTTVGWHAFLSCSNLTIYCQAEAPATDWDYCWNCAEEMCMDGESCSRIPTEWGYTGE